MKDRPIQGSVQAKRFAPARNSECLCGSGHKFKRCCADYLPVSDIGKKSRAAAEADNYKEALIAARSDIAQYTIWHKAHTAPHIRACCDELPEPFHELLSIDVKALSECVEFLCWCYNHLNRADEFSAVLERLRSNIDHPQWHRKITYFHALQALRKDWDYEAGKKELKKLGSMDEEVDVEILQLYTDLFRNDLSFSTRQTLTERIANLAEEPAERLHYQCQSAINLLMVDDQEGATKKLQSAIHDYSEVRDEDNESAYALNIYASAIEMLGQMRQDKLMLDNAVTLFRKFVLLDNLSKRGIAHAYQKLGDALCSSSLWKEAKDAYSIAFEHDPHDILKIFISKCLLYLDNLEDAKKLMYTVEKTTLTASEAADYAFTFTQIAIESGKKEDLVNAEHELRALQIVEPYFKQYQNELLISVIDALRIGPSQERITKTRGLLRKAAAVALRYTLLEPNFYGLGLKVGKILEDLIGDTNTSPKEK